LNNSAASCDCQPSPSSALHWLKRPVKQRQTYLRYLEALLAVELEERERNTIARRIKDAHLPRTKTLDEFDFSKAPQIRPRRSMNWPRAAISNAPNQ
jgi:DNA replication protein DnaC